MMTNIELTTSIEVNAQSKGLGCINQPGTN